MPRQIGAGVPLDAPICAIFRQCSGQLAMDPTVRATSLGPQSSWLLRTRQMAVRSLLVASRATQPLPNSGLPRFLLDAADELPKISFMHNGPQGLVSSQAPVAKQPFHLTHLLGTAGPNISWLRPLAFLVALVAADLCLLLTEAAANRQALKDMFQPTALLQLLLSDVLLVAIAVTAFRWLRTAAFAIALTALASTALMIGVRWALHGGAFETTGNPPRPVDLFTIPFGLAYAVWLLGTLETLLPRFGPVWITLAVAYSVSNTIAALASSLMSYCLQGNPDFYSSSAFFWNALPAAAVFSALLTLFSRRPQPHPQHFVAPPERYLSFLFSFSGRAPRLPYLITIFWTFPLAMLGISLQVTPSLEKILPYLPVQLLLAYWSLAVNAKRLHDRDRTAWWLAAFWVPVLNLPIALWLLVQLLFLRGTPGPNRFGPDALHQEETLAPQTA